MSRVRLLLFGHAELFIDGEVVARDKKPLLLAAALAMSRTGGLTKESAARLVWPDPNGNARLSLRQATYEVNRWAGASVVVADGPFLSLAPSVSVDLWDFEATASQDPARAIELHRGDLLGSMLSVLKGQFAHEVEARSAAVRARVQRAYPELIALRLSQERLAEARLLAERIAGSEPLDEKVQRQLVHTLDHVGDPGAAVAAYRAYATLLAKELGESPSPELTRLASAIQGSLGAGTRPSPAVHHRASTRRPPRALWVVGSLALVFWSVVLTTLSRGAEVPPETVLRLQIKLDGPPRALHVHLTPDGRRWEEDVAGVPNAVWSRGGTHVAYTVIDSTGYDMVLSNGADEWLVKSEPADEIPLAIGPDGDDVLFDSGRLTPEGYRTSVRSIRLSSGREVELVSFRGNPSLSADWSPRGTTIALVQVLENGREELKLMTPAGEVTATLRTNGALYPAWSPDGSRLAFREAGSEQDAIVTIDRWGGDRTVLFDLPAELSPPVWLTDSFLAFVADFGAGGDVWAVDTRTRRFSRLTRRGDVVAVRRDVDPASLEWLDEFPPETWADEAAEMADFGLRIDTLFLRVRHPPARGEYFEVDAIARRDDGTEAPLGRDALQWSAVAGAEATDRPGLFRLLAHEGAEITAELPEGWRDATLLLEAHNTLLVEEAEVFYEDWSADELEVRWIPFGHPKPAIDVDRRVFLNNGDQNSMSGAVTRRRFDRSRGVTVEVEGRLQLTGGRYQSLVVGLVEESPDNAAAPGFRARTDVWLAVGPDHVVVWSSSGYVVTPLPLPEGLDRVHRFGLQVEPSGSFAVTVDGSPYVRGGVASAGPPSRVLIGGSSWGTRVEHGRVWVYDGLRYRWSPSTQR